MKTFSIPILVLASIVISCSTSRQGKVQQGADGKILKASIIARCSPPQKAYAKDMSAKVKAEVDSLQLVPKAVFDAAFEQKVVKLRDYSPRGLDVDLLTFRICEMANNRGLTSEQTVALIDRAISLWSGTTTLTQNVTSHNQTGGITAGIVVVPEDKEIPLENNFTVAERTINSRTAFELKPRQGSWYNCYVAWPAAEDSLVRGDVSNMMPVQSGSNGTNEVEHLGKKITVKFVALSQATINVDLPIYLFFQKRPSVVFFGDASNPKKQYYFVPSVR